MGVRLREPPEGMTMTMSRGGARRRGFSLIEITVASLVASVMLVGGWNVAGSLARSQQLIRQVDPAVEAHLALGTVVERVLRAGSTSKHTPAVQPARNHMGVAYWRTSPELAGTRVKEEIWFEASDASASSSEENGAFEIVLQSDSGNGVLKLDEDVDQPGNERVILRNVRGANFRLDYQRNRLAVEIELKDGARFRTAVQPRNQFTPQGLVN